MEVGMIGLGRMGLNMARRLVKGGHRVAGYDSTSEVTRAAEAEGIAGAYSIGGLVESLPAPRVLWMMVPAGRPVDEVIDSLKFRLSPGDIIVDGGNSYYKDAVRRNEELNALQIGFADVGVSGGVWGLENGYCAMAGGKRETFAKIEPLLKTLAPPEGYLYCGESGAGHFIKMVHNGIEYGLMEAYAEGFELIKASPYGSGVENSEIARLWNRGSVVRSWLLELLEEAFKKEDKLESIKGYVEDSGEGRWMVKESVDLGVPLPVIAESLMRRFRSRQEDPFSEKALAALRHEFGGHAIRRSPK